MLGKLYIWPKKSDKNFKDIMTVNMDEINK